MKLVRLPWAAVLKLVDLGFTIAEGIDRLLTRRKQRKRRERDGLTWRDMAELKRASEDLARRQSAPTVAIPPPSERERERR